MQGPIPSDFQLLDAWKRGDAASGEALFERHFDSLHRFFVGKVRQGADDLVQETLLSCLEARDRFRGDASFRTFIFSVARHRLLDRLRVQQRERARLETRDMSIEDADPSPSQVTVRRQEHELLLCALRSLPLDAQVALELTYWEGLSGPEVARVIDVPVDTAYTRIRRAKDRLREGVARLSKTRGTDRISDADLESWARTVRERLVAT